MAINCTTQSTHVAVGTDIDSYQWTVDPVFTIIGSSTTDTVVIESTSDVDVTGDISCVGTNIEGTDSFVVSVTHAHTFVDPVVDLTSGLVAHYLLNNNADDSHGAFDGVDIGTVDFQGDSARFTNNNGTYSAPTSRITIPQQLLNDFTISFWASVDVPTNTNIILSKNDNVAYYDAIRLRGDNTVDIFIDNVASTLITSDHSTSIELYTITRSGANFSLYKNGLLKGSGTCGGEVMDLSLIGSLFLSNGSSANFRGHLSNLRIYNEVKDQTFIDELCAEGYYPKPLPSPTTTGLIAHYPLTGTAEDSTGTYDSTEVSATYKDDAEFGSVYDGGGSIIVNTSAKALAIWCCYWVDSGAGWVFTKTATIPSSLTTNDYRNLRLYSLTPSVSLQDEIEAYELNFRSVDIDDGLVAYYPLANNSLDNYYNEFDGTDTSMTYDGESAYFDGTTGQISLPSFGLTLTSDWSVSLWLSTTLDTTANPTIFSFADDCFNEIRVSNNNTSTPSISVITYDTGWVSNVSASTFSHGDTNHVVVSYEHGVGYTIYQNKNAETIAYIGSPSLNDGTNIIGEYGRTSGYNLTAELSKVRVYNKVLTPEQIEVIYNEEAPLAP